MLRFIRDASLTQIIIWSILVTGTILSVFTPDAFIFNLGKSFVVHLMFTYLGLGLLFLVLKDTWSTFVAFICCSVLCLVLRQRTPFYATPQPQSVHFSVANFNLSMSDDDYEITAQSIIKSNADIVSIQEVTPDWDDALSYFLAQKYPYDTTFERIDLYGLAIYSKIPFSKVDTFHCEYIPNIIASFQTDTTQMPFHIVSSHTNPPISGESLKKLNEHLKIVADKVSGWNEPFITIGDYHSVPWSNEILAFRQRTQLKDSRRDNLPIGPKPYDHIFYSNHLECVGFKEVAGQKTDHLGIIGKYQIKAIDSENLETTDK